MKKYTPFSPPLSTLLLDLDGTLLDIHMPTFLEVYFRSLAPRFGAEGNLAEFSEGLLASVRLMLRSRGGEEKLYDLFLKSFSPMVGLSPEETAKVFRDYYREEFHTLRTRPFLEEALSMGYELVLATNPVFTYDAIAARVSWAGLEDIPFSFVTSAEVMHFCKPHREYFLELLEHIGKEPDQCLMVGNDAAKDMPAADAGIRTFLFLPPGETAPQDSQHDFQGSLKDLTIIMKNPNR